MLPFIYSFLKALSLDSDRADTKPRASLRLLSASAGVSIRFRKKNEIVFSGSIEKSILL